MLSPNSEIIGWRDSETIAGVCDIAFSDTKGDDGHLDVSSAKPGDNSVIPNQFHGVALIILAVVGELR